ncbi:major facilitator superfamily domain-containing protein [Aspergillus alliaceus]|uniref:Major facilitator superfamily domain-containing protein n=1 Tax=Petromyces alliaceus TaxID=209559 RepID=A0A5N7BUG0_PETAA|nr:major facilitator superfamily domain-containing protein [Aspergillus alliaceus]
MVNPSASPERPVGAHNIRRRRQQILVVLSCFILTFTGCGINFAFGVYEELYEASDGPFKNASPGAIGLIGTLAASLMTLGAPIAGKCSRKYGPRPIVLLEGLLLASSGIAASFGTQLWHFQVSQGFLQGCAACLIYIPAVTVSPGYFDERRAFAMGVITSGTGFGGMVWAPFLRLLISSFGYRQAIRATGVIAGAIVAISASTLKEVKRAAMGVLQDHDGGQSARSRKSLIFSQGFVSHALGTSLQAAAYMIPVYFMSSYARTLGYSRTAGANIIALSNSCNSGGKILIGYYADRLGRLNALVLSTFISAVATLGLCYASISPINNHLHQAWFVVYACGYGMTAGAYVSLFPAALVEQFGTLGFTKVSGLLYMIRGLGTLVGTPLGGALVRHAIHWEGATVSSTFDRTFLFVGLLLFGATISVSWARCLKQA